MKNVKDIEVEILKLKGLLCSVSEDKYMKNNEYIKGVKERYQGKLEALEWVLETTKESR